MTASTVAQYLAALPADRRAALSAGVVGVEKLGSLRQECEELATIFVTIVKRAKTS